METRFYDTVAKPPLTLYPKATEQYCCTRDCVAEGWRWEDSPAGVVYSRTLECNSGGSHDWRLQTR